MTTWTENFPLDSNRGFYVGETPCRCDVKTFSSYTLNMYPTTNDKQHKDTFFAIVVKCGIITNEKK